MRWRTTTATSFLSRCVMATVASLCDLSTFSLMPPLFFSLSRGKLFQCFLTLFNFFFFSFCGVWVWGGGNRRCATQKKIGVNKKEKMNGNHSSFSLGGLSLFLLVFPVGFLSSYFCLTFLFNMEIICSHRLSASEYHQVGSLPPPSSAPTSQPTQTAQDCIHPLCDGLFEVASFDPSSG